MAPALALLSARGIEGVVGHLSGRRWSVLAGAAMLAVVGWRVVSYGHHLFAEYPTYAAASWQHGMREVVDHLESMQVEEVYVSQNVFLAHAHLLFYSRFPPVEYQRRPVRVGQGAWHPAGARVGRYVIDEVGSLLSRPAEGRALLVAYPEVADEIVAQGFYARGRSFRLPDGQRSYEILVDPAMQSPTTPFPAARLDGACR